MSAPQVPPQVKQIRLRKWQNAAICTNRRERRLDEHQTETEESSQDRGRGEGGLLPDVVLSFRGGGGGRATGGGHGGEPLGEVAVEELPVREEHAGDGQDPVHVRGHRLPHRRRRHPCDHHGRRQRHEAPPQQLVPPHHGSGGARQPVPLPPRNLLEDSPSTRSSLSFTRSACACAARFPPLPCDFALPSPFPLASGWCCASLPLRPSSGWCGRATCPHGLGRLYGVGLMSLVCLTNGPDSADQPACLPLQLFTDSPAVKKLLTPEFSNLEKGNLSNSSFWLL